MTWLAAYLVFVLVPFYCWLGHLSIHNRQWAKTAEDLEDAWNEAYAAEDYARCLYISKVQVLMHNYFTGQST